MFLSKRIIFLLFFLLSTSVTHASQIAWYVIFSGESGDEINVIEAFSTSGAFLGPVFAASDFKELRNMAIGPDGYLYVTNAEVINSRVLKFGKINQDGLTRNFLGNVVTPNTSYGLLHPYFLTFDPEGNLYVSSQDTNIISRFYGPTNSNAFQVMPLSTFLQQNYPNGTFAPGTFIPAFTARPNVPTFTPVPSDQGGLTLDGTHSVRGFAFAPNHTLYVADEGKNRINLYDSNTGTLIKFIRNGDTKSPVQVFYYLLDGRIYFGCENRIQVYNPTTDTLIDFINDPVRLHSVSGIAFGEDGFFYAADRDTRKIYRYNSSGVFQNVFVDFTSLSLNDNPEGIMPVYSIYP